jgi:hypothetical protein
MTHYTYPILLGVATELLTRLIMLRTDSRQYPTCLHGKIVHIAMGFIAATLGTVAIPSIMKKRFFRNYFPNPCCITVSRCSQYGAQHASAVG